MHTSETQNTFLCVDHDLTNSGINVGTKQTLETQYTLTYSSYV